MREDYYVTVKRNRDEKTKPRSANSYCKGCDRTYGDVTKKCIVCGFKEDTSRRKR